MNSLGKGRILSYIGKIIAFLVNHSCLFDTLLRELDNIDFAIPDLLDCFIHFLLASRYGLIDYGNSLDKIGPMGKSMEDIALLQSVIEGYDPKDSTSLNANSQSSGYSRSESVKGMKIGVIKEGFLGAVDPQVEQHVRKGIEWLQEEGAQVEEVSLDFPMRHSLSAYYLLATSEASTNLAKYCGMRYGASVDLKGNFNDFFSKVRSENLGEEAKRRIIIGTFARMSGFRDAYYIKAAKVRTLIIQEYKKAFRQYEALVSPTCPILPPRFDEIKQLTPLQHYMMDTLLVGPNLAGLPHLNIPVGFSNKLPVGMLLIADHLQENKLLQLGRSIGD